MARYGEEHKDATRQRIVAAAGRRLKAHGIDGSGIAAMMADAGLTNGAFYGHFESKDDLVEAVIADQLRAQAETLAALSPGRAGLEEFVREYLSPHHRDHPDAGCPSAALLDEIGRCATATKRAYSTGTRTIVDELANRMTTVDFAEAGRRAFALFALVVGTLQLARAVPDEVAADEILAHGTASALALIDTV